ncbi:protein phosphatase 2C domain containing protein [Acanthamoeba castellanii str. Neff]|uniref:Protein phosphatase 2C domain containing protein n=1 Tax=Acanthamoeba castellanii (strain ATCC 30010 / Neff) TaxID=1257118 RepID=L8GW64_ACACF|nr:protein phosphatase 2C domain containing protein [Acanthamoeba castellanii str. Neff]ELR17464.1 protein phosphatase 2C domain containing protein [Acanthamoeba castellanii str. Neff]
MDKEQDFFVNSNARIKARKHKSLCYSASQAEEGTQKLAAKKELPWEREWFQRRQRRLAKREEERLVQLLQKKHSGQLLRYQQERQRKQQQQQQHERRDEQEGEEEGEEGDHGLEQQQRQSRQQEGLVYEMETDGGGGGEEDEEEEHRRQQQRLHDAAWALTNSGWGEEGSWSSQEAPYTPPLRRTISSPLVKSKTIGNYTQQGNDHLHAGENQDRHLFYWDEERSLLWLGVFDGHSGSAAADFLCRRLLPNIDTLLPPSRKSYSRDNLMAAIRTGIIETENQFRQEDQPDGACLLLACLSGEWLVVANVGDSRAVLGSYSLGSTHQLTSRTLTNDHNATNEVEAKLARFRFLKNNGLLSSSASPSDYSEEELIEQVKDIMEGSDIIENGRLLTVQLTRSIGDFGIKRCCFDVVSNEPEFTILQLCEEDRLLILASDGVWATVTADRAVDMVMEKVINLSSYIDRIGPAEYLVQEAVSKGSGDDQTALVLDLNKYRKGLLKPHHATFSGVSPLERTIKKGLFLSDRQCRLNSNMYGSATRSFGAKMALLHAKGSFIGSSEPNKFDVDARKAQSLASSAHKPGNVVPPAPLRTSVLGLFDSAAIEESKAREADRKKKGVLYGRTYF